MKQIKKMACIWLSVVMMMSLCSMTVIAEDVYDTVSGTDATVFGNSSFTWSLSRTLTSDNAFDGTYTSFGGGGATITATKTFYVEETDEYALNAYAASSVTNEWMSDLKFAIDEEDAVTFTSSNSTVEELSSPVESGVFATKNIKYGNNILLEEGIHTITFTVPQTSSYGQKQQAAYFTFDCATLTPTDTMTRVSGTEATTIGNSSFKWNHVNTKTSDNAYDGTYTMFQGGGATITATQKIYVEETNEYALNVYAASSVTSEFLSDLKFAIDGGEAVTFTSNNSTVEPLSAPLESGPFVTKNIKYGSNILLEAGGHTIAFTIPQNSNGKTLSYFTFDCMWLVPIQSLDGIGLDQNIYTCQVGEKFVPELINGDGKKIAFEQFDSVKIEFSEDLVAYAENNAEVTALNKGHTEFKIIALSDGTEYGFDGELYVTDEQGIYITDAVLDTDKITLNVASTTDYSGGDKLIFAVFGTEDGCQTSLKTVYTQNLPQIEANDDEEITQNISAIGEDEFVRIFIINSTNKNRSIYGKITLGLEEAK